MLSDYPEQKGPEIPRDQLELVEFMQNLAKLEGMTHPGTLAQQAKEDYADLYESEYLTEMDDDKFDLFYGTASILRDQILEKVSDPNPHQWPISYYEDTMALIRMSDVLDYGAEGDYLADCVLTIAKNIIKYFELNPAPKVNADLMILEGTARLVDAFYEKRVDSTEAIDCVAMLDLLTAVKKQGVGFAMEPIQEVDEVLAARFEVQGLYEGALEDAESARDYRIDTMTRKDLELGGVELLHGVWMKIASNYAGWLYRVDLKEGAQELAERILKIDATSPVALDVKVNCMLDLDKDSTEEDYRLAEMELNDLLEMLPKQLEYLYTIGRIKVRVGDFEGLGEVIQRLQVADPKDNMRYVKKLIDELESGHYSAFPLKPAVH